MHTSVGLSLAVLIPAAKITLLHGLGLNRNGEVCVSAHPSTFRNANFRGIFCDILAPKQGEILPERDDGASQDAAAVEKIADPGANAPGIRKELLQVLASSAFRGSRRSQKFLEYVVESVLENQCERLKERTIGIELFRREAAYDTGDDAIVRVTANDVRKRLLAYYVEAGAAVEIRIDLPAGSYVPEFRRVRTSPSITANPSINTKKEGSEEFTIAPVEKPLSRQNRWRVLLAVGVLLFTGGLIGWLFARHASRSVSSSSDASYSFYRELLGPIATDSSTEMDIVLSNPHVLLYVGSDTPNSQQAQPFQSVPVPPGMEKILNPGANDTQADHPYHRLDLTTDDYTGMGEAKAAFSLGRLLQILGRPSQVTQARFLNWEDARKQHLILLGAPHMSNWVLSSLNQMNFTIEHDAIRNAHPLAGEQALYSRQIEGNALEDYGLIWMTRTPSGTRLLLLAGMLSTGTAGVGDFLCDPARMRPVYDKLKAASRSGTIPDQWQVLLKINARDDVPVDVSFVALRVYENAH